MATDRPLHAGLDACVRRDSRRGEDRRSVARRDWLLAADGRLDDRTRFLLERARRGTAIAIGERLHGLLADREAWLSPDAAAQRLQAAGAFDGPPLFAAMMAGLRARRLGEALQMTQPADAGTLLDRFEGDARAAADALRGAMLQADEAWERQGSLLADLDEAAAARLIWAVAAAMRADPAHDRALGDGAKRLVATLRSEERPPRCAARLVRMLVLEEQALGDLLAASLDEGRVPLFVALLARATGLRAGAVRALLVGGEGIRLWLALHAAGVDRTALARLGVRLAEVEPDRDLDAFADLLDDLAGVSRAAALDALIPLSWPAALESAAAALARAEERR